MEIIISQISKIAACEGISIGAMEKKIGASKGVLARAIVNKTDIQAKWLQKIVENYPQYSAEWLLTGEGAMLKGEASPAEPQKQATSQPSESEMVSMLRQQLAEKDKQIATLLNIISGQKMG